LIIALSYQVGKKSKLLSQPMAEYRINHNRGQLESKIYFGLVENTAAA